MEEGESLRERKSVGRLRKVRGRGKHAGPHDGGRCELTGEEKCGKTEKSERKRKTEEGESLRERKSVGRLRKVRGRGKQRRVRAYGRGKEWED